MVHNQIRARRIRQIFSRSFLRLTNLDSQVFERLGRYGANLWRQTIQTLLLLISTQFALKIIFQMSVHILGGCAENTDGIRRLISIPF